ncbi:putative L,D-transpeptidase YnhG [Methylobacterium dankookense]|uniref:Putative L,D-transpeptidase YnhG n=2 Tax=Methylobacterium dankookense TaxID=560405 RepID=A0A564G5Y1_9HYPH|nr:hypothetical protein IFDJLNFL_1331 [Methylobacterium dankookense]VUF15472.1 putative L,D-transpeptidase YnhG [Methylobacterium dankookense]
MAVRGHPSGVAPRFADAGPTFFRDLSHAMSDPFSGFTRRSLLAGSAAGLIIAGPLPALAQRAGGYDDELLYQDQNGALYRRRNGRYEPYSGRVDHGRPVFGEDEPAPQAGRAPAPASDPDFEQPQTPNQTARNVVNRPIDNGPIDYARAYAAITDDPFPISAFNYKKMSPAFLRQEIAYNGPHEPGTIVVDPRAHQLLLIQSGGRARRYGVGVGKQGFSWSGTATINSKQAWPDWYPPKEMIARRPDLASQIDKLQSGLGVAGGTRNPLGARAMYLWQNNKDTLFRIHGTLEPHTIGQSVSSGCIRMINQDAIDLYDRVAVGAKVVVLN